jgi:ATP-dependent DNA helicase RecG
MTATPIPRTVAMTTFGDLEVSLLTELPAGRAPIQTTVVPLADQPQWISRVWARVREEVGKGHQAYVVCPRISGDDPDVTDLGELYDDEGELRSRPPLAAVEEMVAELTTHELAGLRVSALHGRMPPEEKDRTMRAFASGEIDVLVSTTVIEVGVDVANATTMVLMDADRFGISQLHQLRGRVGRGGLPGLCLLVTASQAEVAVNRLESVAATTDGFALAQLDLSLRREGDVLGARQSGARTQLDFLSVLRHEGVIVEAREDAFALVAEDPALTAYPELAEAVARRLDTEQAAYLERG